MGSNSNFLKIKACDLKKVVAENQGIGEELAALWAQARPAVKRPEQEYKFHRDRDWRFDLAWPRIMIAIEGEGGIFQKKPSHSSISGILRDIEKYNAATMAGWTVLRIHRGMIDDGSYRYIFDWVADKLERRS